MGQSVSVNSDEIRKLSNDSGMSKKTVKMLHTRFTQLATHKDNATNELCMTRSDFRRIPDLLKNPLGARLIEAFYASADLHDSDELYFKDFVRVIAHFRPIDINDKHTWNDRDAKLRFAFTMYDVNKSGTITRDEFKEILQRMIGDNVPPATVDSIADRTMRETDHDHDGNITFDEFKTAMEKTDIEQKMSFRFLA